MTMFSLYLNNLYHKVVFSLQYIKGADLPDEICFSKGISHEHCAV